jgi:hypothetical protein
MTSFVHVSIIGIEPAHTHDGPPKVLPVTKGALATGHSCYQWHWSGVGETTPIVPIVSIVSQSISLLFFDLTPFTSDVFTFFVTPTGHMYSPKPRHSDTDISFTFTFTTLDSLLSLYYLSF